MERAEPAVEGRARAPLRGVGGGLGAFGLLNLAGDQLAPGFSGNFLAREVAAFYAALLTDTPARLRR